MPLGTCERELSEKWSCLGLVGLDILALARYLMTQDSGGISLLEVIDHAEVPIAR